MDFILLLITLMISTSTPALGAESCLAPLNPVEQDDGLGVPLYYVSGRLRLVPDLSVVMDGTSIRRTSLGYQLRRVRSYLRDPERLKDADALSLSYDLITVGVALSRTAQESGSPEMRRLSDALEGLNSLFFLACRQAAYLNYSEVRYAAWMPLPPTTEATPERLSATLRMATARLRLVEFFSERAQAAARGEHP